MLDLTLGLLGFLAPTGAVVVTYLLAKTQRNEQSAQIDSIHVLVNDRLDKALAEIKRLEGVVKVNEAK